MDLTCPKCQASMRSYERNGVTVDQCSECRGIFLDRGELEKLLDAEDRFHGGDSRPQPQSAPPAYQPQYPQQQYGGHGYGHKPKRKKSFLEQFLD